MPGSAIKKPTPRRPKAGAKSETFSARVDYVAKALRRGSWGAKFDACFEHHDSAHLVAVVMMRAENNEKLKIAVMSAFDVSRWEDLPWLEISKPFENMTARQISVAAEEARTKAQADFKKLFRDTDLLMSQQ